jgi:hypothetical protein
VALFIAVPTGDMGVILLFAIRGKGIFLLLIVLIRTDCEGYPIVVGVVPSLLEWLVVLYVLCRQCTGRL